MNQIYDIGYSAIGDLELITRTVIKLNAWLIDIRLSTRSAIPIWRGRSFASKLGARYRHIPDLGNINYKKAGPVKIKDLGKGLETLFQLLELSNLVLMCACKNRQACHRQVVAREIQNKHGLTVHPLTIIDCNALVYHVLQLDLIPNL